MGTRIGYYKNLDGVRAIAALMVMVYHFFAFHVKGDQSLRALFKLTYFGGTGVDLFFVLSGFLITRILISTKDSPGYFKNFYLRRVLRIFPLYYLFLVLYYVLYPVIFGVPQATLHQQAFYYAYLQNFAITFHWDAVGPHHFWSLAVEEHFYLFWPLVVFLFNNRTLKWILAAIMAGSFVLRYFLFSQGHEVYYFTFTRMDTLAFGALLALMELGKVFGPSNARRFLFLGAGMVVPMMVLWTMTAGEGFLFIRTIKFVFISGMYFALIGFLLCIGQDHPVNKVLRSGFLSYTGRISYGLYVYHPFAQSLAKRFMGTGNWLADLVIAMAVAYALAALSFHLIEDRFLRLKKYFAYSPARVGKQPELVARA